MAAPRRYYSPSYNFTNSLSAGLKKMQGTEDAEMRYKWDKNIISNDEYLKYAEGRSKQATDTNDNIKWLRTVDTVKGHIRSDVRRQSLYEISQIPGSGSRVGFAKADMYGKIAEAAYNDGDEDAYITAMTQYNNAVESANRMAQSEAEAADRRSIAAKKKEFTAQYNDIKNGLARAKSGMDNAKTRQEYEKNAMAYKALKDQAVTVLGGKMDFLSSLGENVSNIDTQIFNTQGDNLYETLRNIVKTDTNGVPVIDRAVMDNFDVVSSTNSLGQLEKKLVSKGQLPAGSIKIGDFIHTPKAETRMENGQVTTTGRQQISIPMSENPMNKTDMFKEWLNNKYGTTMQAIPNSEIKKYMNEFNADVATGAPSINYFTRPGSNLSANIGGTEFSVNQKNGSKFSEFAPDLQSAGDQLERNKWAETEAKNRATYDTLSSIGKMPQKLGEAVIAGNKLRNQQMLNPIQTMKTVGGQITNAAQKVMNVLPQPVQKVLSPVQNIINKIQPIQKAQPVKTFTINQGGQSLQDELKQLKRAYYGGMRYDAIGMSGHDNFFREKAADYLNKKYNTKINTYQEFRD